MTPHRILDSRDAFYRPSERGLMRAAYGLPKHGLDRRTGCNWRLIACIAGLVVLWAALSLLVRA